MVGEQKQLTSVNIWVGADKRPTQLPAWTHAERILCPIQEHVAPKLTVNFPYHEDEEESLWEHITPRFRVRMRGRQIFWAEAGGEFVYQARDEVRAPI